MSTGRPFEGIRIADFTKVMAGPLGTMMLADLGATVIRVEDMSGDPLRGGEHALFRAMNRNKRSIALNLREADGVRVAKEIIDSVDIVVEAQRPGLMDELGLGAEALRAERPSLIYASLTAYGRTAGDRRGVDAVIQADTGMAGWDGLIELPVVDASTGMATTAALMTALYHRERTGDGMTLDLNLLDTSLFLQPQTIGHWVATGQNLAPYKARYPGHGVFETADRPILIGVYLDSQWKDLCEALELQHLITDPKSATIAARSAHVAELHEIVVATFKERSRDEWLPLLHDRGLIAGPVNNYAEALNEPQVLANGSVHRTRAEDGTELAFVHVPFTIRDQPRASITLPPRHGQHTAEILTELGHTSAQIDDFVARRVVHRDAV